ncbi:MAG: hypothetical protein NZZ41_03960 [Candidatus Dojkabacteria bacterium]|nr:hypothetical protein [Candidatus Dojkabacteria bacterium]
MDYNHVLKQVKEIKNHIQDMKHSLNILESKLSYLENSCKDTNTSYPRLKFSFWEKIWIKIKNFIK